MVRVLVASSRYPVNRKQIRKAVADTFLKHKIGDSEVEVSIAIVGERKMKQLVKTYLGDSEKHEILTFPFEEISHHGNRGFVQSPDGILRLGDIILCWPYLLENAAADDIMVDEEIYALTVHGTEHLLGEYHE